MILTLITITIFRKIRVNVTQLQLKLGYNIIDKYSTIICIYLYRLPIHPDIYSCIDSGNAAILGGDCGSCDVEPGSGLELLKNIREDFTID